MEIKIDRADLLNGLSWLQGIVDRKTTMPILSNVLLEAKGSSVTLTVTDLEVGLVVKGKADVIAFGKVTVPAGSLFNIVKELPPSQVHLKRQENNWMQILCQKSQFRLVGLDAAEFPDLPKKEGGQALILDRGTTLEMLDKTAFAMSADETRFNLNGIFIEGVVGPSENGNGKLRMVATDGHRLSLIEREVPKGAGLSKGVIFPRKGVGEWKKLIEDGEGEFQFWLGEKNVVIDSENKTLVVRLIDGQFPPYQQVIPQKQKRIVSTEKALLAQVLRRIVVVTTERSRGVKFSFSPGYLEVSSSNPDLGEAKEEITVGYKGSPFEIGFNAKYFLDVLQVIEEEQVVLQLGDEVSPCLIQSEFDPGFTHVIMPMRL